ncbi:GNAT family N-acetyltransferase [Lapidilactobacillus luobeiensis]|uniref:GNAT family N-acetyltransferase n=1 Tax=Lapidilactobacillus luobeiensis TaxID=2950371 RepID=UPI0021C3DAF1|nr:GNAT family N-acetyltransferase [Lapidilactobacillus luobeiensis]
MIRPAVLTDAPQAMPILMQIIHDMEIPIVQEIGETKTEALFEAAFAAPDYRYGYRQMLVYVDDATQNVLGICVGYPAAKEATIDAALQPYLAQFDLPSELRLFTDVEARPGEWYLDSLAVAPAAQGQGIGGQLLDFLPAWLKEQGETVISLNVDLGNPKAKQLYSHHGFKKTGEIMIGAHRYEHLQRALN